MICDQIWQSFVEGALTGKMNELEGGRAKNTISDSSKVSKKNAKSS
jgi:hypothetical protein